MLNSARFKRSRRFGFKWGLRVLNERESDLVSKRPSYNKKEHDFYFGVNGFWRKA